MQVSRNVGRRYGVPQRFHALLLITVFAAAFAPRASGFESGRASFQITVNRQVTIPYRVFAVFARPGERMQFSGDAVRASSARGDIVESFDGVWEWTAPNKPGATELQFHSADDVIKINAITVHPSESASEGSLQSFRIGYYPEPLEGNPDYAAPDGYIELSEVTAGLELSPHFQIDQFPSKQAGGFPKYLVLRESLLIKLELLLERVNEHGIEADSFTIMSGFRTPAYNHALGNVRNSRHIYGGAADLYIDVSPRDGVMDDLNDDGRLDYRDAQLLYAIAEELFSRDEHESLRGGLGVYRSTTAHGPFIHMDARGKRARWGLLP